LWSAFDTTLVVGVVYFSNYIASGKNIVPDEVILSVLFASTIALNIVSHLRPIRGSENRWAFFGNRSVAWFFAVFVGAMSGALPTLFSLSSEIPILFVVVAIFLAFVFAMISYNKETEELLGSMTDDKLKVEWRQWRNQIAAMSAIVGLVLVTIGIIESPFETWEKLLLGGVIAIVVGLVIHDDMELVAY
jgi:flagellar biosynthesis protein FlhB